MTLIEDVGKATVEESEWVAEKHTGPDGPHLAACWTRNVLAPGIGGDAILIPAWRFEKIAANLGRDPRMELLFAAREVPHTDGQGQGCTVIGDGEVLTTGSKAAAVKGQFSWARGVLVVRIGELKTHLP